MRLLVDLQACQCNSRHRGIGRYSLSLAKALLRSAGQHEVWILLSNLFPETLEPLRNEFRELLDPSRIVVFQAVGPVAELKPENAWRRVTGEVLREEFIASLAPDAVLITSMVEGAMDDTLTSVGWRHGAQVVASVLYDLIPLMDPEKYIGWAPSHRWYMNKMDSMRRCDLLLAISGSAKREAEDHLGVEPDRVVNISTAADAMFVEARVDPQFAAECRARLGIDKAYLMHSGNVEARKNFAGLIRAFGALPVAIRRKHQLVLVGRYSSESKAELEQVALENGLAGTDLVLTGHVTDEVLMALYAGCHLFVFPSLHEGFGLPALEAMHFGVPTIGSKTSSVPEVIGRDDALFDPASVREMSAAILRALTDTAYRQDLARHARRHAATFTWEHSAQQAWSALEQALGRKARPSADQATSRNAMQRLMWKQLAVLHGAGEPSPDELLAAGHCHVLNEGEALRVHARAGDDKALTWRVEGPFDSTYSLALVNRETARSLAGFGHEVILHSTEGPGDFPANPSFLAAHPDLASMHARVADHPHQRCQVVSRLLYPPRVSDMAGRLNILHPYAWEESGFPEAWVKDFNRHLQGITCLSTHVEKVLRDNGVNVPLATAGCGVDHWERIDATPGLTFPGRRFRFLHVSSCFPRKGADVLLAAFGQAFSSQDDVSLLIKTFANPHNTIREQLASLRAQNPAFPDVHIIEGDLSDPDLKALYQHCDVLVAPSRAEGFGLPMAEAMLSGLPVITTAWGGQLDFCNEQNAWLVDYSFVPAESHFELFGSVWAEPDVRSLVEALRRAHAASRRERSNRAARGRRTLLEHYRWSDVTARALAAARAWLAAQDRPAREARVGWITTWNTKCGIATYARHIVQASREPDCVLAPRHQTPVAADEDFVRRCWVQGKERNELASLASAIDEAELDALVIQFNFGFFNFQDFAEFVHEQVDAGRTVVVVMHATVDPPHLAEFDDNWRLSTIQSALARCARVLVHSLGDLNHLKRAGLTENVVLFPHPLWKSPPPVQVQAVKSGAGPVIATFGFCLPHKGLPETLDAVARLKRQGTPVRLLMLNAEYPDPVSTALVKSLRKKIADLGLSDSVDFRSTFMADGEVATLLGQADLLVFPYQNTQESASGAVRHGMSTGKPILVTPLPIFDELQDAAYRAAGVDPASLAAGILHALNAERDGTSEARGFAERLKSLRSALDVERLASRLWNMVLGLGRQAVAEGDPRRIRLRGSSRYLRTQVGEPRGESLRSLAQAGMLMFGPYLQLPPGGYRAELVWKARVPRTSRAELRAVVQGGQVVLATCSLPDSPLQAASVHLDFELLLPCKDLELQVEVDAGVHAEVLAVGVHPSARPRLPAAAPASASSAPTAPIGLKGGAPVKT